MFEWAPIAISVTVSLTMLGWLFKALSTKANKDSTDARFAEMMGELKEQRKDLRSHESEDRNMHKEVLAEIRETNRHLSMTNATLSNLAGRFEAMNGKHP